MAGRPLRPATDRRLGEPLPHQLANPISAAPIARGPCRSPAFSLRTYAVLAILSDSYPPRLGTFRYITHPFAARRQGCPRAAARLACVKHSASVQSEPGSNSSVQSVCFTSHSNESQRSNLHSTLLLFRASACFYTLSIQQQQILHVLLSHSAQNSAPVFQPGPAAIPSISE